MPCVAVIDWLWQPPRLKLRAGHVLLALAFPALYLLYVLLRGSSVAWYPYPFLNPANVGGYPGVAVYSAGIAVAFGVVSGVLFAIGNRLGRPK
jgi:hypothetical protein